MKKINRIKQIDFWILVFIFLIGAFFRFYALSNVPNGFDADEAAFGYNAYSILTTGKDEYGQFLPLVLKSFGDFKAALYAYFSIPFIWLFGLNIFAARAASVALSSFMIILMYLFTKRLVNNKVIALIAASLFAILPWSIIVSRVTGDVSIGTFFAFFMAYCLLILKDGKSKWWSMFAVVSGVLAILSNTTFRLYTVLIPLLFLIISIRKINKKIVFSKSILYFTALMFVIGIIYTQLASAERFNQVSIFSNPKTQLILEEQIREDQFQSVIATRIFHNKIINFSRTILENTGQYLTMDYLFLNGGFPFRERIPNHGLLYIWQSLFLLIGIYVVLKKKKRNEILLLLWWAILLLPTIITFDEIPNIHRNLIIMPAIVIIISIGIYEFFYFVHKRSYKINLILITLFSLLAIV